MEDIFDAANELFKDKWLKVNTNKIPTKKFLEYFEAKWIQKQPGWYEGYASAVPSTNNGLESTNRVINNAGSYSVKLFADKVRINHKLWVQSFHLSINYDRPTCYITDKQKKKTSFMSSGRTQNGKLLVTENNIQKEVKRKVKIKKK